MKRKFEQEIGDVLAQVEHLVPAERVQALEAAVAAARVLLEPDTLKRVGRGSGGKAKPDTLYHDDNGAIVCGACAGTSLKHTLRTLSGHRARPWTASEKAEFKRITGAHPECERCGKTGE